MAKSWIVQGILEILTILWRHGFWFMCALNRNGHTYKFAKVLLTKGC